MRLYAPTVFILGIAGLFAAAVPCSSAQATCKGGGVIKGNFGVLIDGPLIGGSAAQVFSGVLTADGACGLSGTLTGGVFGQGITSQSVTGSYSVPGNHQAQVILTLPGSSSAVTFQGGRNVLGAAYEIRGIAVTGSALTTLDMVAITNIKYSVATLSGTYIAVCTGSSNSGSGGLGTELGYVIFDGKGNFSSQNYGSNDGSSFFSAVSGTYQVNADGTFTVSEAAPYSQYTVAAEIVAGGLELRSALLQSGSGGGAYRGCVYQKQS